ncbi:GNAT family N-acetyltransferase [Streptomyces sp. NPDC090077]|uniref:GNAT family N-acetyltransferase n=1 Tax=Streptomyces sp. NPDC090077 TaxID=3365938 RepID=UPI0038179510
MTAWTHPTITFTRRAPEQASSLTDQLLAVYSEVYDTPPYVGDPFFAVTTYASRLQAAYDMEGFEVVSAHLPDGAMAGYVHGVTLTPDRAWWESLLQEEKVPAAAEKAAAAGDVFWLRELMVLPTHTGQGLGRALHDAMVHGRRESWTTLTCITDNEPARSAYPRWGYEVIGRIKHAPESPVYDAMVLPPGA